MSRIICIIILIINCLVSALSQVLLKSAAGREYKTFIAQYLNIRVIAAYMLYALVVVANMRILRYIPITIAMPFTEAAPLIMSVIFGRLFFSEKITVRKIIGSAMILGGIVLICLM